MTSTRKKTSSKFCRNIEVSSTQEIRSRLQQLGRSEDIKFSPDCSKLAIAGFREEKLLILDIEITSSENEIVVSLTDFVEITSSNLQRPHGLFFIDNETLIVTNRRGEAPIFRLPASGKDRKTFHIDAELIIGCDKEHHIDSPGSVSVYKLAQDRYEILICNNYAHHVSRHILETADKLTLSSNEKLLCDGLEVPDGVCVNKDNRWIAISNHDRNCVSLYENTPRLNTGSCASGTLRNIIYPHGIRFTPDDRYLLVADAGSPYLNIYTKGNDGWNGTRPPQAVLRVIEDDAYWRGRTSPQEGGVKGIDIDIDMRILVTTCKEKPLQFFDLQWLLAQRGVPFDKHLKYLWWRHGWRYENLIRKLAQRQT